MSVRKVFAEFRFRFRFLLKIKTTLFVFFILQKQNVLLILWVHTNKTICSFEWCVLLPLWGKITAYFNFPLLLRKKMQVISPPCPSKRASASTFSTNDLIFITHLSYIFLFISWNAWSFLWLKSCFFEKAKLIKHMLNSLSGAGRLVFKKK